MTGESVSGLLVLVGSRGASDKGEAAEEACWEAVAAPSSVSPPGLWHSDASRSSAAESTATTTSTISKTNTRKEILAQNAKNRPFLPNKRRMFSTREKNIQRSVHRCRNCCCRGARSSSVRPRPPGLRCSALPGVRHTQPQESDNVSSECSAN